MCLDASILCCNSYACTSMSSLHRESTMHIIAIETAYRLSRTHVYVIMFLSKEPYNLVHRGIHISGNAVPVSILCLRCINSVSNCAWQQLLGQKYVLC